MEQTGEEAPQEQRLDFLQLDGRRVFSTLMSCAKTQRKLIIEVTVSVRMMVAHGRGVRSAPDQQGLLLRRHRPRRPATIARRRVAAPTPGRCVRDGLAQQFLAGEPQRGH